MSTKTAKKLNEIDEPEMIVIVATVIPKKEKRKEFVELATNLARKSKTEKGCIVFDFYQDMDRPDAFFFYEEWESQEALDIHCEEPYFLDYKKKYPGMLDAKNVTKHQIKNTTQRKVL